MKKTEENVTLDDIHEICGYIPPKNVIKIVTACKSKSFDKLEILIKNLISDGYSAYQFISQLSDWIISEECDLDDKKKSLLTMKVAKADQQLLEGSNEYLQCFAVCSYLATIY